MTTEFDDDIEETYEVKKNEDGLVFYKRNKVFFRSLHLKHMGMVLTPLILTTILMELKALIVLDLKVLTVCYNLLMVSQPCNLSIKKKKKLIVSKVV